MRFELMTSSLPMRRSTPELRGPNPKSAIKYWSGRRDSNSRPSAWKADALPTELHPLKLFPVQGVGFEPTYGFRRPGLQPGAINHSTTPATTFVFAVEPAKGLEPPTL